MAPSFLDYYFGDTVEVNDPELSARAKVWFVLQYNYSSGLLALCSNADGTGWMPVVDEAKAKLIKRGNLFNHLWGFPVEFADITEETSFWIRAGKIRTITNPMCLNLVWSLDQAISALSSGRADAFQPFEGLYSPQQGLSKFYVYKAADPEIGRRLRRNSLEQLQSYQNALKA